ncbi:sulfite exporter TauE/SafE family protein [Rubrivirga sp. S365]|uniref:Probable membrane transporter protein n=1 Tax=Rubrivirga litoralis TaxID=3075598 RepID=A0ABU3BLH9_9BACT|nr:MULTISPECIES: sulfite exporter TauE/SafE family protein [unclassified Rubrivirga]MDT0630144.1 sulfite exporter TauE/SafE family protein [Rubrivirga sp. F394]MDT7855655.1 sulfite exporter TauE/SafE family protein [Rubrivirga sp. S365]
MLFVLLLVGAVGGFVAGLVGVGGGVVFGPALFFAFGAAGVADPVLTPLTLGTSLLCTFAASASGTVGQWKHGAIDRRTALVTGAFAAVAVVLVGRFVSTQPWYDKQTFQVVLGLSLVAVVARMLTGGARADAYTAADARTAPPRLAAVGGAAGTISALAGIGGGVVLVPAFAGLVRLPTAVASGTSTAAITIITAVGVATYVVLGWDAPVPPGTLGYVDWRGAAALALPAVVTARLGVSAAHRIDVRYVRYSFAAFAAVVAARLLWKAFS